ALITGSFTLVSEAINLDLLPHMQIRYPSDQKGQLYISLVNTILWVGCCLVVLYFRTASRIENAYGLAITISMLMTTLLLVFYLVKVKKKIALAVFVGVVFGALELLFFIASLGKFMIGGYVAIMISLILLVIMYVWDRGTVIEHQHRTFIHMKDYLGNMASLRSDKHIAFMADNLVFFSRSKNPQMIERDILYSILDKDPKRAKAYWFVNIKTTDQPFEKSYSVETYGTEYIFFVTITLGFKVPQRVNVYLRQIVQDLIDTGELPEQERKFSIYGPSPIGNFKFCFIRNNLTAMDTPTMEYHLVNLKYRIRRQIGDHIKWYGLENSQLIIEYVPLFFSSAKADRLERINPADPLDDSKN
ncbi:MAG: KUP/HAK/KT family potassium transporter, partial [Firmicutes bacterium]|nr:KUP/HAK/KT family potassium transporter [Bacillota bacterium]